MAGPDRRSLGHSREKQALRYLQTRGLELVEANFHTPFGEIDLVMRDSGCLVFVEVRYRQARGFAGAAESVDGRKRRKLILAAELFLRARPRWADRRMRFDVVAIDREANRPPTVTWIRDAFRPGD